ncbi:Blue-light-activated histidine kinase [Roseovarius sp. THAF9]|uniref:PAS domain S-box protein n=1 Tax=Roseovarius sp. THAF9 TaxID=2587847 RepID=UPI001267F2EF|nr:PAS domain S-box protein [Roseovarius sp. THAF9]QFT92424.1 Blue-light-activated histidine kinase [Roseovarius sp. THAF9]
MQTNSDAFGPVGRMGVTEFIDALPDEFVIVDRNGVVVAANSAWKQFGAENGGAPSGYVGSNYFDICRAADGESSMEARLIAESLEMTLRSGETFVCEYPCDSPTVKRWFELTATRMMFEGQPFLTIQHRNVTQRYQERDALKRTAVDSNALAALVAGTSDAILTYDLEGKITSWNPAAERLYGYSSDEIIGRSLETLYPSDEAKPVTWYRDEIIAGRLDRFEAVRIGRDGTAREVWISCAPIRGADGDVVAISNIHRDITELRRAEKARELMSREVIHRAKNMLTIVSAVQRQTARSAATVEDFHAKFGDRIAALSKSTDLLVGGQWDDADLRELVMGHLRPFTTEKDARVRLSGPEVRLLPQAVQTLGIALHELATNAMKYGALAHDAGDVLLTWKLGQGAGGRVLDLIWRESKLAHPPEEDAPGFGSTVLTSLAPSMLGTQARYHVDAEGVHWTISIDPEHFSLVG